MTGPTPQPPWQDYLEAARALQAVRREHATESEVATRAASALRAELTLVRAQLVQQRARLHGAAARNGGGVRLRSSAPERAAADSLVAGGPATVAAALQQCRSLITDGDAALADDAGSPGRRPRRRWVVAAGMATVALVVTTAAVGLALAAGL